MNYSCYNKEFDGTIASTDNCAQSAAVPLYGDSQLFITFASECVDMSFSGWTVALIVIGSILGVALVITVFCLKCECLQNAIALIRSSVTLPNFGLYK